MRDAPSNTDDVIDSRDVIARIEELEGERADLADTAAQAQSEYMEASEDDAPALADARAEAESAVVEWDADNDAELAALKALAEECEGYAADWRHGETLIRDSYFRDYAQELAEEIDAVNRDAAWPNNCIDWDQAARELQMDYTQVDFDGVAYWIR